jgi:very-short-patch-repair endonuclease
MEPKNTVKGVASRAKVDFAREQRKKRTRSERILWEALRRQQLGVKFRRQHPFNYFVLDFFCAEARLAVEVDGPIHEDQKDYDRWRDEELAHGGIAVLRLPEEWVRRDLPRVLQEIREALADSEA